MKRVFKVQRKLGGSKLFRKWDLWTVGDVVIGKLVGYHDDDYGHKCPIIEVLDAQFKDEAENQRVGGKQLVLNSCGVLAKALESADLGDIIQVAYTGQSLIEKGKYKGKKAHTMDVDLLVEEDEEASVVQPEEIVSAQIDEDEEDFEL